MLAVATATSAGCADDTRTGPYEAYVIAPDAEGHLALRRALLDVDDPRTLANRSFTFETRSEISFTPTGNPESPVRGSIENGQPLDLALVRIDGAYAGADYEGTIALSIAHHLLVAQRYFDDLGLARGATPFPKHRVVLDPSAVSIPTLLGTTSLVEDNAFYSEFIGGFAVLRKNVFDDLPLGANLGVLVHEFSHAVYKHLTRDKGPVFRLLTTINEGLADVHGAAVTGDARFVARSLPHVGDARDLARLHAFDDAEFSRKGTDPYWYGSILASTFWGYRVRLIAGGLAERDASAHMSQVAFDGIAQVATPSDPSTIESDLWTSFAARATAFGERAPFCASFVEHLGANSAVRKVCK